MTTEVNGLFICPYNQSHMVDEHKLANHLVRCRNNNPNLAKSILVCPYNQCHHVPREEMEGHFRDCKEYHTFQALAIKPAVCQDEKFSMQHPLQNVEKAEQEHLRYIAHRKNFQEVLVSSDEDPATSAMQQQKNIDDLDEWFVE